MSHLFPTELIGSYALPSWLWMAIERAEERGDLGESDIEETLNDAVNMALLDQEKAGVDVFTDGEMRRRDFIQNFYGLMNGLNKAGIELDRKVLSDIAIHDAAGFTALVEQAKAALDQAA